MTAIKHFFLALTAFGSGLVIAGAVFTFISSIGVVTRLAVKTKTEEFSKAYEYSITFGGIFGASTIFIDYYLPIGRVGAAVVGLFVGIFYGCLAVSLAEVLDVIPIFVKRAKMKKSLSILIVVFALGKLAGSLVKYFFPNFF